MQIYSWSNTSNKLLQLVSQQCCARIVHYLLLQLLCDKFRVASCGEMLRRVQVTSTLVATVLRQLVTWKCVAQ